MLDGTLNMKFMVISPRPALDNRIAHRFISSMIDAWSDHELVRKSHRDSLMRGEKLLLLRSAHSPPELQWFKPSKQNQTKNRGPVLVQIGQGRKGGRGPALSGCGPVMHFFACADFGVSKKREREQTSVNQIIMLCVFSTNSS